MATTEEKIRPHTSSGSSDITNRKDHTAHLYNTSTTSSTLLTTIVDEENFLNFEKSSVPITLLASNSACTVLDHSRNTAVSCHPVNYLQPFLLPQQSLKALLSEVLLLLSFIAHALLSPPQYCQCTWEGLTGLSSGPVSASSQLRFLNKRNCSNTVRVFLQAGNCGKKVCGTTAWSDQLSTYGIKIPDVVLLAIFDTIFMGVNWKPP